MIEHYDSIRDDLDTGDIVLFAGKGRISEVIKWFSKGPWSHVGMVWRSREIDAVLLIESTTLNNLPDVHGVFRKGVQTVFLSERLANYEGMAAIRKLSAPRSQWERDQIVSTRKELKGRPYEVSTFELLRAAVDVGSWEQPEDLSSLFCSELVAEFYQRAKWFDSGKPSNEYTPNDFSSAARVKPWFIDGVSLGDEMVVSI